MEKSRDDADDVVYEILLRLPVKALKRFQCVCKSWSSLISSPQFQKNHFRHAQQNSPRLLTLNGEGIRVVGRDLDPCDEYTLGFSTYNNEGTLTPVSSFSKTVLEDYCEPLMQSCLGLVCIFHSSECRPIIVCIPSTEELISLPYTGQLNFCVGFGYATSTQEFKVVGFFSEGDKSRCQVCTFGTSRHWRELKNPPYFVSPGTAPFLHRALHFIPHIDPPGVRETDYMPAVFHRESFYFRAYPTDTMGGDILLNCSNDMGLRVLSYDPRDGIVKVMYDDNWAATFYVESFYRLGER